MKLDSDGMGCTMIRVVTKLRINHELLTQTTEDEILTNSNLCILETSHDSSTSVTLHNNRVKNVDLKYKPSVMTGIKNIPPPSLLLLSNFQLTGS